jgi:2Fe-2S ferredoxin
MPIAKPGRRQGAYRCRASGCAPARSVAAAIGARALAHAAHFAYRGQSFSSVPDPMAKITYIAFDGTVFDIEARDGTTVMENAVRNAVPGIEAECGGACACATCHVYVDEAWVAATGEPEPMEEDMLDFAQDVQPNSRLSCQIRVKPELDGLIVRIPERQG